MDVIFVLSDYVCVWGRSDWVCVRGRWGGLVVSFPKGPQGTVPACDL